MDHSMLNNPKEKMNEKKTIEEVIDNITQAWLKSKFTDLEQFLDDQVVFVTPDFEEQIKGKDNCMGTFKNFAKKAIVNNFSMSDKKVELWGNSAIGTYRFTVEYEVNQKTYREQGNDIMVFKEDSNGWKVIWRSMTNNKVI